MTPKEELRRAVLARRGSRPAADRERAGRALASHGVAAWSATRRVAAYLSVGTEPPTRELLDGLHDAGVEVLLPVVTADALDWAAYAGPSSVLPGRFGLLEPTGPRLGLRAVEGVDAVIVPALAVDRAGNRLGRGRGFYDRALADVRVPVTAVVFDEEVVATVPVEPHDRPVTGILAPGGPMPVDRPAPMPG
ncbi:MAG TPA: 5-formyltetrahydrofolate cyclo-ligase [Mycobacteriales bacterium]|nr:5-formyltetrahydrofolate cyclo-ligase [Mycobacteriales bacterium]